MLFKKTIQTAIIIVFFLNSAICSAGTLGKCTNATCITNTWSFEADPLYLEMTNNDPADTFALIQPKYFQVYNLVKSFNWGFKLAATYYFRQNNDLNLNWYYISSKKSVDFSNYNKPFGATVLVDRAVKATYKPNWNQVNLEIGNILELGDYKGFRLHVGLQYSNFKQIRNLIFINSSTNTSEQTLQFAFKAIGPRLGGDLTYEIFNGLSFYGKAATAFLVSNNLGRSSLILLSAPNTAPSIFSRKLRQILPEIDGKLGISYNFNLAQADVTFDIGWLIINYFNAYQFLNTKGDLGFQGLFFGFKMAF